MEVYKLQSTQFLNLFYTKTSSFMYHTSFDIRRGGHPVKTASFSRESHFHADTSDTATEQGPRRARSTHQARSARHGPIPGLSAHARANLQTTPGHTRSHGGGVKSRRSRISAKCDTTKENRKPYSQESLTVWPLIDSPETGRLFIMNS